MKPDRSGASASLCRRLGVERIDLLSISGFGRTGSARSKLLAAVGKLIDAGKVRAGGVSNFDVEPGALPQDVCVTSIPFSPRVFP